MARDVGALHMESLSGYGHLGPAARSLKERVVDRFYDPVSRLLRMVTGG